MPDLDTKELRNLAKRTAGELHMVLKTSNADNARHLWWRLSVVAKHMLSQLGPEPATSIPEDTRPPTQ